jgi:membrane protease YdiL (CAAX protease family)
MASVMAGNKPLSIPVPVEPIALLLFLIVIGEEIGWRGFLLAGLLWDRSPIVATAVAAVAWAIWHEPLVLRSRDAIVRAAVPRLRGVGDPDLVPPHLAVLGTRSAWLATVMHGNAEPRCHDHLSAHRTG